MASPVACVGVADAGGAPSQASLSNLPGLQLLLRILPFRSTKHQQHPIKLPHASTLGELHRHPLWRYGSTAAQWPEPRSTSSHHSSRPLAPAEAESALLAYVRMAAEAEQQPGGSSPRQQARRLAQLSPTDIAAELHALYTLAAIHVASQQESSEQQQGGSKHKQHHGGKPSLTDGDFMQLLKAYSALEDRSHQQQQQHQPGDGDGSSGTEWDSQAQAAAAAVGALYAFAKLADQQQEQEQSQQEQDASQQDGQLPGQQAQRAHQPTAAPGQLRAGSGSDSSTVHQAFKSLAASSSTDGVRGSSSSSRSSSSAASGDLQVLLKLAQLGLQAASG